MKICDVENHFGGNWESLDLFHVSSDVVGNVLCFSFNVGWHLSVALYSETTWTHMSERNWSAL